MIPVLGTAMWGWTVPRERAFALADGFLEAGGRWFDTAANYPIDKDPAHHGLAERWLGEWLASRGGSDVAVIAKAGGLRNDGSPACDVSPGALAAAAARWEGLFGPAFRVLSVHWDDREDSGAVAETATFLAGSGREIGLSGLRRPDLYAAALPETAKPWIQIKHNVLSHGAYAHYAAFHGRARFLAYGVNAGGIKPGASYGAASAATVRGVPMAADLPAVERLLGSWAGEPGLPHTFNELGLAFAATRDGMEGAIIGPSSLEQLAQSLSALERFGEPATRAALRERLLPTLAEVGV